MPKQNIDYSKMIFYKIKCTDNDCKDIYVGSTTDFNRRKSQHKYSCNNCSDNSHNFKLYKTIRKNGGWNKFKMVIIEKCPCKNRYTGKVLGRKINLFIKY
jgi:hypothetical protein